MATIQSLVDRYLSEEKPVNNLLDEPTVLAQAIAAVNFYAGYADLEEHKALPVTDPPTPYPDVTPATGISLSEWSVIKPLFALYVERETAFQLEATRTMGIDVFGRGVAEVVAEIMQKEQALPHEAFCQEIVTV